MKKEIKAIIFDYGGVISRKQNPRLVEAMRNITKLSHKKFKMNYQKYRNDYDLRNLSAMDYWLKVLNGSQRKYSHDAIQNLIKLDVESWTIINKNMLRFIVELHRKAIKKAIISNMTVETLAYMKKHFHWLELFDHLVFSCEIGSSKPDKYIFTYCLRLLDMEAHDCVFIDDVPANIEIAQRLNLNTILFKKYKQFRQEMDSQYTFN